MSKKREHQAETEPRKRIRRCQGEDDGPGPNQVHVIVRSLAGGELFAADICRDMQMREVKEVVARELDLHMFGFELLSMSDGLNVEGLQELGHLFSDCPGTIMEFTLVKHDLPKPSTSHFLRLQSSVPEDANPTYQGRQDSMWATLDVVGPRLLLVVMMILLGFYVDVPFFFKVTLVYAMYLTEALGFNAAVRGVRDIGDIEDVTAYIQRIKSAAPAPKIEVRCWHWETRRQIVTDGQGRVHVKRRQEKVYTDTYTDTLTAKHWTDVSGDFVEGVAHFPLLQIHYEIAWEAVDDETLQQHDRARQALIDRARARDAHHDFKEYFRLTVANGHEFALPQSDMISATSHHKPAWLGFHQYAIASVFGLSWPYRWWLASCSIKGDFVFRKALHSLPNS
jgi:hypothetical protein